MRKFKLTKALSWYYIFAFFIMFSLLSYSLVVYFYRGVIVKEGARAQDAPSQIGDVKLQLQNGTTTMQKEIDAGRINTDEAVSPEFIKYAILTNYISLQDAISIGKISLEEAITQKPYLLSVCDAINKKYITLEYAIDKGYVTEDLYNSRCKPPTNAMYSSGVSFQKPANKKTTAHKKSTPNKKSTAHKKSTSHTYLERDKVFVEINKGVYYSATIDKKINARTYRVIYDNEYMSENVDVDLLHPY